ncbi:MULTISPECIES: iron chaperone [Prauserella salsuginis group]|uniref:Uncharacterized protein YdhG (YjbR/CyaY superfamily) n=2 Tax=Prauserella salsuginis group TaxID=2893672 RepID=A0A839XK72_9PSEU|nr:MULTISPECIES: DUF1801 domain-containing protein [Prauserella salsuginis group]MBB3662209.1 uncharacterized protein YdhG (YjbR/CyaY superfamily) [Prauserella sediminis]MCR3719900.1 Uncharacterized conserved protein YdhG, YjbR/CyaY-like superfamily, DUF1801 family [Prauserella flava]MCR3736557.1 Uncharacterized conserved protein YdhG, YjbR/CyaY-like superfamily, DUF1801 family [Prauserella salsuginis]
MARAQSVDEYLDRFDPVVRQRLETVRELAREAAPGTTEAVKWGEPAWIHASGTILFMLGGYAKHISVVFTPSTREAFDAELGDFNPGKGSVKIGHTQDIPEDLLRRMIVHRISEYERDGVNWM